MNYGRIAAAAVAATVVYYIYGFLVEGLLIQKDFSPYSAVYRSAETVMPYLPLGLACTPIGTFVIAMLYGKGYSGTPGATEGARFGVLAGILMVCTFVGPNYVTLT